MQTKRYLSLTCLLTEKTVNFLKLFHEKNFSKNFMTFYNTRQEKYSVSNSFLSSFHPFLSPFSPPIPMHLFFPLPFLSPKSQ